MDIEKELNTAVVNEAIAENKGHILEKELEKANNRIKRLESKFVQIDKWHQAKEAKA
jgi:hypothetical protein